MRVFSSGSPRLTRGPEVRPLSTPLQQELPWVALALRAVHIPCTEQSYSVADREHSLSCASPTSLGQKLPQWSSPEGTWRCCCSVADLSWTSQDRSAEAKPRANPAPICPQTRTDVVSA